MKIFATATFSWVWHLQFSKITKNQCRAIVKMLWQSLWVWLSTLKDNIKQNADRAESYLIGLLQNELFNSTLTIERWPVKDTIKLPRKGTKQRSKWQFWDENKESLNLRSKTKLNWNLLTLQKSDCGYCGQQFWAVALSISISLSGEWFMNKEWWYNV